MATLEELFRQYARSHPTRDGGTWDQWCGSLMYRICDAYGHAPTGDISSAWTVWRRTATGGTNAASAPAGAFHFWDIGGPANGHVGVDLTGGGTNVGMATRRLRESLGTAIGINSVAGYTSASGARYVGWCHTYADGDVSGFTVGGSTSGGSASGYAFGLTVDAQKACQQALTNLKLYTGKIDGAFGAMSVSAMQQYLKNRGFLAANYEVDGEPGNLYGVALQKLAAEHGYTGPLDGDPGTKTSEALIKWASTVTAPGSAGSGDAGGYAYGLNSAAQGALQTALTKLGLYTGKVDSVFGPLSVSAMQQHLKNIGLLPGDYGVDGEPGPKYGEALQKLAAKFGYTGAIDGVPGDKTSEALVKWAASITGSAPTTGGGTTPTPTTGKWPTTGTFGIDVASPQRDIDFKLAKAGGAKFAIIKMGGLNVTPQYVAPHYVAQVGRARAAGLKVGHYYLLGLGQTPEQQAQYFVKNLADFRVDTDVLALDNEKLDDNGARWNDADAARFIAEVIRLTGIDRKRIWHYGGAFDYRANMPWTKVAASGARFWWAAYGANNGTRDHEPDIRDSVPEVGVHQFSSVVDLAGYKLDGNWSKYDAEVLFAKGSVSVPNPDPGPGTDPDPEPVDRVKALLTAIDTAVRNATAPFRE